MNNYYQAEIDIYESIAQVARLSETFLLEQFSTNPVQLDDQQPLTGHFSLHSHQEEHDLYGMCDAVYILYTLGKLRERTTPLSRGVWANAILACQDERGWFSKRNKRGHSREHATAYALGALTLLQLDQGEGYVVRIRPLADLYPILTSYDSFLHWIKYLQFQLTPQDILAKNVGWHHIWRGSHIGGGIAAIFGMAQPLFEQWWPGQTDIDQWFSWYFSWLDSHVNPATGYWQRAFWNWFYRKPTLIDMGGAVHFLWVYEAREQPFSYPEKIIEATLTLQRGTGLYKDHPFCIDLDGNFCMIRAFLQLSDEKKSLVAQNVYQSITANFEAVIRELTIKPLTQIYTDSHGLPGALAALAECKKLPDFPYTTLLAEWQNPLDRAWWL